jgi:hypothetical protein
LSGNLTDASGFYDRRAALTLGESRSLFLVGIDAAEFFAVRIVDGHKPMVVLPPTVLAEAAFLFTSRLLSHSFRHSDDSYTGKSIEALSQGIEARASTVEKKHVHSIITRAEWNTESRSDERRLLSAQCDGELIKYIA